MQFTGEMKKGRWVYYVDMDDQGRKFRKNCRTFLSLSKIIQTNGSCIEKVSVGVKRDKGRKMFYNG